MLASCHPPCGGSPGKLKSADPDVFLCTRTPRAVYWACAGACIAKQADPSCIQVPTLLSSVSRPDDPARGAWDQCEGARFIDRSHVQRR